MVNDFVSKNDLPLFTYGSRIILVPLFLKHGMQNTVATFDLLVREFPITRNYLVFAGLEHVAEYLTNLHFSKDHLSWLKRGLHFSGDALDYLKSFRFTGDLYAMREGTLFFPNEPLIRITAPIIEAQIIEIFLMNCVLLQTVYASKFARFIKAANGKEVIIGTSRSYGTDAAMKAIRISEMLGAKAAIALYDYLRKGKLPGHFNTFHYLILSFNNELNAFRAYLRHTGGKGFVLIDTYNSINGIKNFILAAKELEKTGKRATGILLDSGNLYNLSIIARKLLNKSNLRYVKISVMSNLDEWKVAELERKHAPIDVYAGMTELMMPHDAPSLELVYKLSELGKEKEILPKMKTSTKKISLPGRKQVFRLSHNNKYYSDIIGLEGERINQKELLIPIIKKGKAVYNFPNAHKIKKYFYREIGKFNLSMFDVRKKFDYPVTISDNLQKLTKQTRAVIESTHYYDNDS